MNDHVLLRTTINAGELPERVHPSPFPSGFSATILKKNHLLFIRTIIHLDH